MIHLTRNLARQLRTLLRRAKLHKTYGGFGPNIQFSVTPDGLRIHSQNFDVAITHLAPSPGSEGELWLPISALDDFYGKDDSRVSLAPAGKHRVTAQWTDRGIPHATDYEITPPKTFPGPPELPSTWSKLTAQQWQRLGEATKAADDSSTRYALGCLQLRGTSGEVAATDGRQVIIQSGYEFGFTDEILIQANSVLGNREVLAESSFQFGRSKDWVTFGFGRWSLGFKIQTEGRFPHIDTALPKSERIQSRLILNDRDAEFLVRTLPTLPGNEDTNRPVTVYLRNEVCLRGRSLDSERITELVLSHSRREGEPVALNMNREFLLRAIELGHREIGIVNADTPVMCQNESGSYVWALLAAEGVIKPCDSALRIESSSVPTAGPTSKPLPRTMPIVKTNNHQLPAPQPLQVEPPASSTAAKSPIELAITLRDALHTAANQANDLAKSLKRQRRETQLIKSTLSSLQQLERAAA